MTLSIILTVLGGGIALAQETPPGQLFGACCFPDGSCTLELLTDCNGGSFQGIGSVCSMSDCGVTGGCCLDDTSCVDGLNAGQCEVTIGGTFQGPGVTCSKIDCVGDPNCPGEGDCFENNGTPGCDDPICCNAVCAADPFCCVNAWDNYCASAAFAECEGGGCSADTNNDGIVSVEDLLAVILDWGTDGSENGGDITLNGTVDVGDLVEVIVQWGPCFGV